MAIAVNEFPNLLISALLQNGPARGSRPSLA
jgi:hypothetical protein